MSEAAADATDAPVALVDQFRELATALVVPDDDAASVRRLLEVASAAVEGSEHASVTLHRPRSNPRTVAATDDLPARIDELQYRLHEGPCLDALAGDELVEVADLSSARRWPVFGPAAARLGVRSMLCFRLTMQDDLTAALNFFAAAPRVFGDEVAGTGSVLASFMSLSLRSMLHRERSLNLERAVQSNRDIGVATGILMAARGITRDQAFDELRRVSQRLNRKLHDVAEGVARTGQLPPPPPPPPRP